MVLELGGGNLILGGYSFTTPVPLGWWRPAPVSGIYAILAPATRDHLRVIYFGESSEVSVHGFPRACDRYRDWVREAGSEWNLYVAVHRMSAPQFMRKAVERELVERYRPVCNRERPRQPQPVR